MLRFYFWDVLDYLKNKLDYSSFAHRLCCLFGGLIMADYLMMCIFCFLGALDDMELFSALGASYSFGYHLIKNYFPEVILEFLLLIIEFLLYVILYYRVVKMKHLVGGVWYFGIVVSFHVLMLVYAASLDSPEFPFFISAVGITRRYYLFSCKTMLQSIGYLISYFLRIRKRSY